MAISPGNPCYQSVCGGSSGGDTSMRREDLIMHALAFAHHEPSIMLFHSQAATRQWRPKVSSSAASAATAGGQASGEHREEEHDDGRHSYG
ncbi:hypothetical protein PWT90_04954 [Aphanocladium album]|nr:hypothetical protein PWT90_04954 [Aphanocladium album]